MGSDWLGSSLSLGDARHRSFPVGPWVEVAVDGDAQRVCGRGWSARFVRGFSAWKPVCVRGVRGRGLRGSRHEGRDVAASRLLPAPHALARSSAASDLSEVRGAPGRQYVADGKDAATVKEFADFLEAHGGKREAVTDASIDMRAAFEAGIKANFENAEITFDKFHVIKLANEAIDEVRRQEAKNNFQIKGRRYIFLKNVDHLTQEEKEALSRLEAQNLDTIQAMQIRMNLQQLFAMDAKTARRFLDRWNAWVQVCDLGPMKRLAKTIMAKADGILRSIATGLSNGVLEAINGNVQAAKRKAKGYRTKRNLKAVVYLIAGDVLANSPT